jgi:hypothetical protein
MEILNIFPQCGIFNIFYFLTKNSHSFRKEEDIPKKEELQTETVTKHRYQTPKKFNM